MTTQPTVFVVDDDELVRESVVTLVESMGGRCRGFSSAEEFLDCYDPSEPGCVITDVRMPGMSGLELQQRLIERGVDIPVIVITGFANTPAIVDAMQKGAVTVLEKPWKDHELFESIRTAFETDRRQRAMQSQREAAQQRLAALTPDEREVLEGIVQGQPNKAIARSLGVSVRTVEARRQRVFQKLEADSVAEIVTIVLTADGGAGDGPTAPPAT